MIATFRKMRIPSQWGWLNPTVELCKDPEAEHYGFVKKMMVWVEGLIHSGSFQPKETCLLNSPVLIGEGETSLEDDSEQEPSFKCSESLC